MLIACPNCSTRYNIDPGIVGAGGRKVRCLQCGNIWIQKLPDQDDGPDVDMELARTGQGRIEMGEDEFGDEAFQETPPPRPRPQPKVKARARPEPKPQAAPDDDFDDEEDYEEAGTRRSFPIFWLVAAVVVLGIGIGAVVFLKDPIIEVLPSEFNPFADARPPGEIWDVRMRSSVEPDPANANRLIVAGEVYNTSSEDLEIPTMVATIRDAAGNPVKTWEFKADSIIVLGGDKTTFRTSFEQVNNGAKIEITFVDE